MALVQQAGTLALALAVVACSGQADDRTSPEAGDGALAGDVRVSAAASLTDAFAEISSAFEAAHPGVHVVLNLAGSSSLRAQILDGAPVDVFASANPANMDRVVEAGEVAGPPGVFAHNRLEIAVPTGNPAGVRGLEDFADGALRLGLCAASVPCGDFARRALQKAGVTASLDTNEPDVRALLTKVELGELDAGIVYATDVAAAHGSVEGVAIPDVRNVVATYPIAVLSAAPHPAAARAFVDFVLSAAGRVILARYGFGPP